MKVLFVFPSSYNYCPQELGKAPSHAMYGFNEFRKLEKNTDFFAFKNKFLRRLDWWILDFFRAIILIPAFYKYDAIFSAGENASLFIGIFRSIAKFGKAKHVALTIALNDKMDRLLARLAFGFAVKSFDKALCLNTFEAENLNKRFSTNKFSFLAWGVDTDYFRPQKKNGKIILSAGKDKARDYQTLVKALEGIGEETTIICSPKNIQGIKLPENIKADFDISYERLREFYKKARLVVVPSKKVFHSSGQTVLLEAMACGLPTTTTRTLGIENYATDNKTTLLAEPGNANDLRKKIMRVLKDKKLANRLGRNARAEVVKKFSCTLFARELLEILEKACVEKRP